MHFLVSHPTPPVFDVAEDRNGKRNHDEIRFWADYVTPAASDYIYDDDGRHGGLRRGEHFVIAGDQNADPFDGDSVDYAIRQLLDNPRINTSVTPTSPGGPQQSRSRAERTPPTTATRPLTRPTSPTARRATCGPTTCCPTAASASRTASCSGR